jgi:choice-of-anchor B domain-containing protein
VYSGVPCLPTGCIVNAIESIALGGVPASRRAIESVRGGGTGASLPFNSLNVTLMSQVSLGQMGGTSSDNGSSLYGWVDPLTQREYAIMGREQGTSFVDITNPTNPVVVGNLPRVSGSAATSWREPKVYGNHVYVGVDGTSVGMQIMDLTKLRNYAGTTMTLGSDSVYNGVTRIHTLAVNPQSGHLYLAGTNANSGGLRILDVKTNPLSPTVVGNTNLDGYTHETQVVTYGGPDPAYQGREIAVNSNGPIGRLSILDVTNKAAITRISFGTYANDGYIHQGWFTEDQRYFFQNDELDEDDGFTNGKTRTHLWDLNDLDAPVYKGFFDNVTTSIDHNLYVKGDYVYQTNYTTGLRILKIGNLASGNPSDWLTEVAFFDTYQANDSAIFNGAWNNYPFFPSGNVAISDINGGLFVVRPNLSEEPTLFLPYNGMGAVPEPASLGLLSLALLQGSRRSRERR